VAPSRFTASVELSRAKILQQGEAKAKLIATPAQI